MRSIPLHDHTDLPPADRDALATAIQSLPTLADVLAWAPKQIPPRSVAEIITQDRVHARRDSRGGGPSLPRVRHHLTRGRDGGRRLRGPTGRSSPARGATRAWVASHAVGVEGRAASARLRGVCGRAGAPRGDPT